MGRNFKKIKAWQFADELAVLIYEKSKCFPKDEIYGLISQLKRAAVSIPNNIAEGASREHKKEYLHFLYIARGSIAEVEYLLHLSKRLKYLKYNDFEKLESLRDEAAKILNGLIKAVAKETKSV